VNVVDTINLSYGSLSEELQYDSTSDSFTNGPLVWLNRSSVCELHAILTLYHDSSKSNRTVLNIPKYCYWTKYFYLSRQEHHGLAKRIQW